MRSPWHKSLSCVGLGAQVFRAYRPAHRHISRATIQDVLMLFYDLLPFVGDRIVHYLGSEERLRLGIAARRLHPAISWARWHEGRRRLQGIRDRLAKRRNDNNYHKLMHFSYIDNTERWDDSDSYIEKEGDDIIEAMRTEQRLRRRYLKQLLAIAEVRRRPYLQ